MLILCVLAPTAAQDQTSAWGAVITLGEGEQRSAPALWINRNAVISTWVADSDDGVRQFIRAYDFNEGLSVTAFLPIPPVFPHQQYLIPAGDANTAHLFWLDAAQANVGGGVRVWGDVVTADLGRIRGEIPLSSDVTYHYDVIELADGVAQLVWSAGNAAEPTLFARQIDPAGRPRTVERVAADADWPSLLPLADGRIAVYWLSRLQGTVGRVILSDDGPTQPEILLESVQLSPGDQLLGFDAAHDRSHIYLFWTVRRAGGEVESWFSTTADDQTNDQVVWTPPTPLTITLNTVESLVTGFNGGDGVIAASGDVNVLWATPLTGRFDLLAVAAQVDDGLGVLYLQAGEVVGYQRVVTLAPPGLIGFPALHVDRARHLYLAWAQPTLGGPAVLALTTTR